MSSRPNPPKKPSGSRPNVRRLFSKDSLSPPSSSSGETFQESFATALPRVPLEGSEDKPWLVKEFAQSPSGSSEPSPAVSVKTKAKKSSLSSPSVNVLYAKHGNLTMEVPSRPATTSPPPMSPSRARWEQVRQHVLPTSSKTMPNVPTAASPAPSFTSFSQLNLPAPRPATPKPSRLARFGFRQVVAEAREAADDLTRKFADDIQKACWSARFGDVKPSKPEREPAQPTLGSALHLPFMSSASLPLSSNASTSNLLGPGVQKHGLRRPPSTMTLAAQTSRSNALAGLQSVIVRYASVALHKETAYTFLPHEKEVLSVLLITFLSQSTGRIADEERRLSLEIYETIIKTWRAQHVEAELERCLWCCKAATMPASPLRSRVLLSLTYILSPHEPLLTTPIAFRSILPGLAFLIPCYSESFSSSSEPSGDNANDLKTVRELITDVMAGRCGRLDLEDLEQKYQSLVLEADSEDDLRRGICCEALIRCLEFSAPFQRRILLREVERYWASPGASFSPTPLRSKIHLSKITTFLRAALKLLHELLADLSILSTPADSKVVLRVLTAHAVPELETLGEKDDVDDGDDISNAMSLAVRVVLALTAVDVELRASADESFLSRNSQSADLLLIWLNGGSLAWRDTVQKELKDLANSSDWLTVISVASNAVVAVPIETRKTIVSLMLPQLQERLVSDPPPVNCDPLSNLLANFAQINPQIFYKPLFVCAASAKEAIVAHQLAILAAIAHYMPQFWTTDAEMVSIALMSDPTTGGHGKGKGKEGQLPSWGTCRLGQAIVMLEVIGKLRSIRVAQSAARESNKAPDAQISRVAKFAGALETRLSILLEAKEQDVLLPLSQRILLTSLFLEIRLIMRSLKPATWLQRIVSWTTHHAHDTDTLTPPRPSITLDCTEEVKSTFDKLNEVLTVSRSSFKAANQRRNTILVSPGTESALFEPLHNSPESSFLSRMKLLASLPRNPLSVLLELLVAMCGALRQEDLVRLIPVVWDHCLQLNDPTILVHACFICMQCAEKTQDGFLGLLTAQMISPLASARRQAVQKLSTLSSWRFQLMSLTFITDRTHRRPFKLARPPISFVATDVGSSNYVRNERYDDTSGRPGNSLPLDLRRHLSEIGWAEEDKPMDQQYEWLRTPISLLASNQLDRIAMSTDTDDGLLNERSHSPAGSPVVTPSKSPSPDGRLLRRNSSSGGHSGAKRRPVFVQPLVIIFLRLASLAMDSDFEVADFARDVLMDFMRDDPTILCRPVVDILSGKSAEIDTAITTLRTFLHIRRILPPRLTHHVFNHLAGFLKYLAKESSTPDSLRSLAHIVPVLVKFAPQVSEMSVRAIRRAKFEVFMFPSATLWFPETAPFGLMFPKRLEASTNPFDEVPYSLLYMTMIRISQNLLFVDMLKRSPQDVHLIRKGWTRLILPNLDDIEINDVIPRRFSERFAKVFNGTLFNLSLSFSRSHLLLVAEMFRCMTRHLNDREELANLLDGVNRILLRHGDDIGIVCHILIVYMIASTRFRRLMSSGTGFTLFLPALLKVYCEADENIGVREAIEYAVHRFFAVHEEVFVFQALHVVSSLAALSSADGEWIASSAYHLLSTLKSSPSSTQDPAGIHDANKAQEEETALAITADERPQIFLASLRKDGKTTAEKVQTSLSVDVFDNKRFQPDNLVRMILTVIAHDPAVRRAEYFLRLFRFLALHIYEASNSARSVLRDGIEALGAIISAKITSKSKASDQGPDRPDHGISGGSIPDTVTGGSLLSKANTPCDIQAMRSDYLLLYATYVKAGGQHRVSSTQRSLDLAKLILKESSSSPEALDSVRVFVNLIAETFLLHEDLKQSLALLKELAPIISAHGSVLDFSGLLETLVTMCSNPIFANDPQFSSVIVKQICSSALDICELAASENALFSLPFRSSLVMLLARATCLLGADPIAEIEKRSLSPAFLSGVVLPFIFKLRTTSELATNTQWTDSWRQDSHARAWVRLLSLILATCETQYKMNTRNTIGRSASFSGPGAGPGNETEMESSRLDKKSRRRGPGQSLATLSARLAIALVTLKAVILRGEDDISSIFPGAWFRVGEVLRSLLRDGSAEFALRGQGRHSPLPSALPSPAASTNFSIFNERSEDKPKHKRSSSSTSDILPSATFLSSHLPSSSGRLSRPASPSNPSGIRRPSTQSYAGPRLVDYLTWSLLEFVCLRRSPLAIQLRTFMHERTLALDEVLRSGVAEVSNNTSVNVSKPRRSMRPVSTIFSKPRFGAGSAPPTPDGSPRLGPSDPGVPFGATLSSLPNLSTWSNPSPDGSLQSPAFPRLSSPISPVSGGNSLKKRIVHLGPNFRSAAPTNPFLSPSNMMASASATLNLSQALPQGDSGQSEAAVDAQQALKLTVLRSPKLVHCTFQRVRVVQACLGYRTLLPVPKYLSRPGQVLVREYGDVSSSMPGSISASASPRASVDFEAETDPDLHVWTKRKAAELLLSEAEELLNAWQMERTIVPSDSDPGQGAETFSAATSMEGDFDFVNSPGAANGYTL